MGQPLNILYNSDHLSLDVMMYLLQRVDVASRNPQLLSQVVAFADGCLSLRAGKTHENKQTSRLRWESQDLIADKLLEAALIASGSLNIHIAPVFQTNPSAL